MAISTPDFCKKKGFMYPSNDLYGGLAGFYDYGHHGKSLKNNFENKWRKYFLNLSNDYVEIEASEIMHKDVFKASGHLDNFVDPVAISKTGQLERADHLVSKHLKKMVEGYSTKKLFDLIKKNNIKSSVDGSDIVKVDVMNLMFPINMGRGVEAYLRPETAQSPYINFKRQHEYLRKKIPVGLASIGRAYRNEISPRNFTIRQRGFTQAELQIFFNPEKINECDDFKSVENYVLRILPGDDRKKVIEVKAKELAKKIPVFYVYHLVMVQKFYYEVLNFKKEVIRFAELKDDEKAFYNKYHYDIEADLKGLGWTEIGGVHYRTDHDLKGHQKQSSQNQEVLDDKTGKKYIPHVLELSFGVDRNIYALIDLNLKEKDGNNLLSLAPFLSPVKIAVFPLLKNKPELVSKARQVFDDLKKDYDVVFDATGSIGRRYARQDEIGTPLCLTVDFESLDDDSITIRYRDTSEQDRIKIKDLKKIIDEKI